MIFGNPYYFLLLLLIPVFIGLFMWTHQRRRAALARFGVLAGVGVLGALVGSAAGRGVSGCDRAPPQVAYAQPPQGAYYPPPQQGYAPPQQGYAPPPQGYAPPQDQQGYAPPPPAPPAYYPAAAPAYAYYDVPGYYYAPPPVTVFAPPLGYYWYHGRYWGGRGGRRWR